jgi:hypothetical protein
MSRRTLAMLWRLRYKLSLRDLPEMFLIRGIVFIHEAVPNWEAKLAPAWLCAVVDAVRSESRYVDETHRGARGPARSLSRHHCNGASRNAGSASIPTWQLRGRASNPPRRSPTLPLTE